MDDGRQTVNVIGQGNIVYNLGTLFFIDKVLFTETSDVIAVMEANPGMGDAKKEELDFDEGEEDFGEEDFGGGELPEGIHLEEIGGGEFSEAILLDEDEDDEFEAREEVEGELPVKEKSKPGLPAEKKPKLPGEEKSKAELPDEEKEAQELPLEEKVVLELPVEEKVVLELPVHEEEKDLPRKTRNDNEEAAGMIDFPEEEWTGENVEEKVIFVNNQKISILTQKEVEKT